MTDERMYVARSAATALDDIVADLLDGLPEAPAMLVVFFAPEKPGEAIVGRLASVWPETPIIGCSTAGEIATRSLQTESVVAAALDARFVRRSAVALADYSAGVKHGVDAAVAELETTLGPLAALDPRTHVGIVLIDSTHGVEERTNVELGNHAPLISFVGGSAGDNLAFAQTRVVTSAGAARHGAALMLLELARPFRVSKACHFEPTTTHFRVTRADGRRLLALDGRPAAEVYARYIGCAPHELCFDNLFAHPAGLVIDGEAWVRQVVPPVHDHGAVTLGCEVAEGAELYFLKRRLSLVGHLRQEIVLARAELGQIRGALMFDCALRRLELERTGDKEEYARLIEFPAAGFHTHGESWLGHMHQTLTAVYFG